MNILKKLQKLPESKRKAILWTIIIILSLFLLFLWIGSAEQKLKNFQNEKFYEEINLPEFKEELKTVPKLPEQELKELKELIEKNNEQ